VKKYSTKKSHSIKSSHSIATGFNCKKNIHSIKRSHSIATGFSLWIKEDCFPGFSQMQFSENIIKIFG